MINSNSFSLTGKVFNFLSLLKDKFAGNSYYFSTVVILLPHDLKVSAKSSMIDFWGHLLCKIFFLLLLLNFFVFLIFIHFYYAVFWRHFRGQNLGEESRSSCTSISKSLARFVTFSDNIFIIKISAPSSLSSPSGIAIMCRLYLLMVSNNSCSLFTLTCILFSFFFTD